MIMDASTAVQILGTIAETYGAILAIGAGFFTFLIQRLKEETRSLSERLEKDIDLIVDNYDLDTVRSTTDEKGEVLEYSPDLFKENVMKNGPEWIVSFLGTELPRVNLEDSYFPDSFQKDRKILSKIQEAKRERRGTAVQALHWFPVFLRHHHNLIFHCDGSD